MEKEKNKSDFNLIKKLFNIEPIDWARSADGRLAFISPTGQKFVHSVSDLEKIEDYINRKAAAAKPPVKLQALPGEGSAKDPEPSAPSRRTKGKDLTAPKAAKK